MESSDSKHYVIIGAGIMAYIASYYLWRRAKALGEDISISIYEKNKHAADTTVRHLMPSLTPDEISDVIPPAQLLIEKYQNPITEAGGIRVDDVPGINNSQITKDFFRAIKKYAANGASHQDQSRILNQLGLISMQSWQDMYDNGDEELQHILRQANFRPCKELELTDDRLLHQGYRIDLIYNIPSDKLGEASALDEARATCARYEALGYQHCAILSPDEVIEIDPYLAYFCEQHSRPDAQGRRQWLPTAAAIWRPGGFINTQIFLPLLHEYLTKVLPSKFVVHLDSKIVRVDREQDKVLGLGFLHQGTLNEMHDEHAFYLFCPGENVGTLHRLGFPEPEYARFAGASLMMKIPLTNDECDQYEQLNRYMYLQQEGLVVSCHVRKLGEEVILGIGGTSAYYGDNEPCLNHEFAKVKNTVELNLLNDVFPQFISKALGRDTKGETLSFDDVQILQQQDYAKCWVGSRSAAFDGFPTLGSLAENAACITHVGSGGVSFCHALVKILFNLLPPEQEQLVEDTLRYASPQRTCRDY